MVNKKALVLSGRFFIKDEIPLFLEYLDINYKYYVHEPVFTVSESRKITGHIPGGHTKNLFLRDKKHQYWLITTLDDSVIETKLLKRYLSARGSLSFVDGETLYEVLGVRPGSVSPLAIINDRKSEVKVVLDFALFRQKLVNVHPLSNDATVSICPLDLFRIFNFCRNRVTILDFANFG